MTIEREQILALAGECGMHPNHFTECTERFYHAARKPLEEEFERLKEAYDNDIARAGNAELRQQLAAAQAEIARLNRATEQNELITQAHHLRLTARISELETQGDPVATVRDTNGMVYELNDEIDQLLPVGTRLYLRAPQAVPEWQPIETAPKDGTIVLFAGEFDYPGDWRIKIGYWAEYENDWHLFGGMWPPSRWMPLPAAPSPEGEKP